LVSSSNLPDEIAGSSQLDRALARLRRQGNRYECSETSGVDHFYAGEVDHDSMGLGRKLGNFAGQRVRFNAISDFLPLQQITVRSSVTRVSRLSLNFGSLS
jgi:hypothetical protein